MINARDFEKAWSEWQVSVQQTDWTNLADLVCSLCNPQSAYGANVLQEEAQPIFAQLLAGGQWTDFEAFCRSLYAGAENSQPDILSFPTHGDLQATNNLSLGFWHLHETLTNLVTDGFGGSTWADYYSRYIPAAECKLSPQPSEELVQFAAAARQARYLSDLEMAFPLANAAISYSDLETIPEFKNLARLADASLVVDGQHRFMAIKKKALKIKKFILRFAARFCQAIKTEFKPVHIQRFVEGQKQKLWPLLMAFKNN